MEDNDRAGFPRLRCNRNGRGRRKYLRRLEYSDKVDVLFGIAYVVLHFLDTLGESQKQLMMNLPRNENCLQNVQVNGGVAGY